MLMGPSAGVHSSASAEDVPLRGCARDGLAVPAEVKKCLVHKRMCAHVDKMLLQEMGFKRPHILLTLAHRM